MDKEKLLQYFQTHYLSKREVLFRLPLSLPIDSFWRELQNRRKSQATVLPLYNAAGKPYWFSTTDTMVTASEKLCEAALAQDNNFDPYRVQMTGAILQECFFTSFVEGAQIPVQEAMDFLQGGTEPENIQEQMLWNNRNAWTSVMNALYRPIDENMLKSLAYMLTEDMEGCSDEYRQTDQHPIVAMNQEPYSLPSAFSLPDRMSEYCEYLQSPNVHPLIKSAVGQAYILAIRPFPEGNERMSRMISYIILMRSGYEFFRDISISGMIARESFRYYKGMCEILREENDGDLTYFIEYYLGMLVRAFDDKKESDTRYEQEVLENERRMSKQPLSPPDPSPRATSSPKDIQSSETVMSEENVIEVTPPEEASSPPPANAEFWAVINEFKNSKSASKLNIARVVPKLLANGKTRFTFSEWKSIDQRSKSAGHAALRCLIDYGLVKNLGSPHSGKYAFILNKHDYKNTATEKGDTTEVSTEVIRYPKENLSPSPELMKLLTSLETKIGSPRDMRIGKYIKQLIEHDIWTVTAKYWSEATQQSSKYTCTEDLRRATCLGILTRVVDRAPNIIHFRINPTIKKEINSELMTERQKQYTDLLYARFGMHKFTVEEGAMCVQRPSSTTAYHLTNLATMGILKAHREAGNLLTYTVTVTPEEHPECYPEPMQKPTVTEAKHATIKPPAQLVIGA